MIKKSTNKIMRMWMVNPRIMCNQHLLGEHVELHMLVGNIKRGKSIDGFLSGLVDPSLVVQRHEELALEMVCRGMDHKSPIDFTGNFISSRAVQSISEISNLKELANRCKQCSLLMKKEK
jgi:hypothetical protein